jgi:hypothetical protein
VKRQIIVLIEGAKIYGNFRYGSSPEIGMERFPGPTLLHGERFGMIVSRFFHGNGPMAAGKGILYL